MTNVGSSCVSGNDNTNAMRVLSCPTARQMKQTPRIKSRTVIILLLAGWCIYGGSLDCTLLKLKNRVVPTDSITLKFNTMYSSISKQTICSR